jgi:hypothetical protein
MIPFLRGIKPLENRGELFLRTRKEGLMVEAWVSVDEVPKHFGGCQGGLNIEKKLSRTAKR